LLRGVNNSRCDPLEVSASLRLRRHKVSNDTLVSRNCSYYNPLKQTNEDSLSIVVDTFFEGSGEQSDCPTLTKIKLKKSRLVVEFPILYFSNKPTNAHI